ncbi:hypothetical protein B0J15DRAFT_537001 [Fusarium solani]|uniref:RING-type domain-containing protein n=1 Tax=Fusarium solani TaxID=169388 RepID=A0A9P9GZX7_FUSSL|nr:uncharacterized protein B0J15DRAFT_537001 [Fusarium solani]KAH7248446.1 hypothetical protein B0J15DRAFT_537001 [Fusarium solani]
MRPPWIAILVLFLSASLFLLCRSIFPSPRSVTNLASKAAQDKAQHAESAPSKSSASVWAFTYYNTLFSLFSPNAAISLINGNSTSFIARPAAFGPRLAARGLTGQLWVGSGFAEDTLGVGGELGCNDLPGWDKDSATTAAKRALRATVPQAAVPEISHARHPKRGKEIDDRNNHDAITNSSRQPNALVDDVQPISDSDEIKGKVVLLMRGGCRFLDKVMWAQRRGAIAVIVGDNQKGIPLIQMLAHGPEVDNVAIPSVFSARTTAQIASSLAQRGSYVEDTLDDQRNPGLKLEPRTITPRNEMRSVSGVEVSSRFSRFFTCRRSPPSITSKHKLIRDSMVKRMVKTFGGPMTRHGIVTHVDELRCPDLGDRFDPTGKGERFLAKIFGSSEMIDDILDAPDLDVHEGLWVTLTPTSNATDILLVLVITSLITLTVYALLILRAKIRRKRWTAPKSVVERLPVLTYHTIASPPRLSPRAPSPTSSSPTTPLLLKTSFRLPPRPRTATGFPDDEYLPAPSSAIPTPSTGSQNGPQPDRDGASGGFSAEWRKYRGRQIVCVVCQEEYVDGMSQVMSLPCGHVFHADCITPWLTTCRRTCPICGGDVVQALVHGSSSEPNYEPYRDDSDDDEEPITDGSRSRSSDHESDLVETV